MIALHPSEGRDQFGRPRQFFEWPADYGIQPLWRKPRDRQRKGPTNKRAKVKAARKANLRRQHHA